jgi:hypothetical protein
MNDTSAGNCLINSFAKDFSSVRVNGGIPRCKDSLIFGIDRLIGEDDSDSFDVIDSVFVESKRLVNPSVRLAYVVDD